MGEEGERLSGWGRLRAPFINRKNLSLHESGVCSERHHTIIVFEK